MKILVILFVLSVSAASIKADPLTFTNVSAIQNGNQLVNLFSNPNPILFGSTITFVVDINGTLPAGGSDTLAITFRDSNNTVLSSQLVPIPLLGSIQPPVELNFSFSPPVMSFAGVPYTLTLDLLNSNPDFNDAGIASNSYTYSFRAAQPVPEPTTLFVFGIGSSTLLFKQRKKIKK